MTLIAENKQRSTVLTARTKKQPFCGIISRSPAMEKIFETIAKLSKTTVSVLIAGESGTGKELVARAIHETDIKRKGKFVTVHCGAIPAQLLESLLFGHEKGAFTGAYEKSTGSFEFAEGGTIFLDEISTMPLPLQVKLLRVLNESSFNRVGGNEVVKVDLRVVSASNIDLREAVRNGSFREDLFYRLNVVPLNLPPLRDRVEDIPLLIDHFIDHYNESCMRFVTGIAPDALAALLKYRWPGNVRELQNLIERLIVLESDGQSIERDDLPEEFLKRVKDLHKEVSA